MLADLKAMGYRVVGIEVDEAARRMTAAKGIEVFRGYAEAVPDEVKSRSMDVVLMKHVLEHCLNPLQAVRNAA